MCKQNENEEFVKKSKTKRSIFFIFLGVPMIFVAALTKYSTVFTVLILLYVILLFINGIVSFKFIKKNLHKKKNGQ